MDAAAMLGGTMLAVMAVVVIVGVLVAGLVLKFVIKMFEKPGPSYGRALLVVIVAGVLGSIVNMIVTMVLGVGGAAMGDGSEAAAAAAGVAMLGAMGISLVAGLFINAFVINWLVKRADGGSIGFGRSLLIALVYLIVMVVLGFIASIVMGMLFAGGMMAMGG